ncbi:prolactin-releasing peptide receptor-like [Callorhinchus milii]|uniref:prolactin-releasing peptide receptor-like n=1 Tax=Callorhinchus milii TaxID=7868 RepID=UPI001C3FAD2D|nr:prolactin-releasing peptide receptor-like [Callorhinchus milii]
MGAEPRTEPWGVGTVDNNTVVYELALGGGAVGGSGFTGVELIDGLKPLLLPGYALLVMVGLLGNSLLLHVICRSRKMHGVTNFLIANLALADLLMCAACVPFTLAYVFNPRGWVFGSFLCYFVFLMQPVTVYVSVFTLTAIAVDRYYATVHPLKKRLSMGGCWQVVAGVWLLSGALAAPALAHTYHVELPDARLTICEEFWVKRERERLAYAYSTLIITYILPVSAVALSYLRITIKLRGRVLPGTGIHNQERWERVRRKKIFRLLVLLVTVFGACWLPLHLFNIVRDVDINLISKDYFNLLQLLCHWLAMSSACYNPFLYAWLHDRFRAELLKMFACRKRVVPATSHCADVSVVM